MTKTLVIGGTGTVGSQVIKQLLGRGVSVRVLTRSADKAKSLPPGVEGVVGDLLEPETLRPTFAGVDRVFLLNAVSPSEATEGLIAVNAARRSAVSRIVYVSVHRLDDAVHLPHFGSKLPIEMAIKASGLEYTILRPNNFYQNDYWYRDIMRKHGLYPQPIGDAGISRVDVNDIAEAAAIALTTNDHVGEIYNLVGPDALTGANTARVWSRALGRQITYAGSDLQQWEQHMRTYSPPWMVFDIVLMYEFFQRIGARGTATDLDRITHLLGRPPRPFEDFAVQAANEWR